MLFRKEYIVVTISVHHQLNQIQNHLGDGPLSMLVGGHLYLAN